MKLEQPLTPFILKLVPSLVAVAFFMESLDATILNTAVPMMAKALGVAPLNMKSVLSLAVFIPISSWIADRFGTRRVFGTAIGLFTLGSILCGLANDIRWLVVCRVLQGFGGAMMVPVGRLTLVRTFAKSDLLKVMNFVAVPALIGPMLGPLVGGLIVGFSHWRMIFFVNLPIGVAGLYYVYKYLPDFRMDKSDPLDWVGLILFGSGIAIFSYVLEVFGETDLGQKQILRLLGLSIFLLVLYGIHSLRREKPLLRLGILKIRTLRAAVAGNFFTRLGAGGMPFLLPLLYQVGLGFTPIQSGLLIMPQPMAAIFFRFLIPGLLSRFGYQKLLLVNTFCMGLSIAAFSTITTHSFVLVVILQACAFGFFSSLQYTSMNTLAYADVMEPDTSLASTILSTVQQMSLSFGVAAASLVTTFFLKDHLQQNSVEIMQGLEKGFLVLGLITVISGIGFAELKDTDGDNVSHHNEPKPEKT